MIPRARKEGCEVGLTAPSSGQTCENPFYLQSFREHSYFLVFNVLKNLILEKEMATHSSILAWKSPWTEEPGGLKSMGLHD